MLQTQQTPNIQDTLTKIANSSLLCIWEAMGEIGKPIGERTFAIVYLHQFTQEWWMALEEKLEEKPVLVPIGILRTSEVKRYADKAAHDLFESEISNLLEEIWLDKDELVPIFLEMLQAYDKRIELTTLEKYLTKEASREVING